MRLNLQKGQVAIVCVFLLSASVTKSFAQSGWHLQNAGITSQLTGVYFTSVNNGTVVAFDSIILRTTDAGASWFHEKNSVPGLTSVNFSDSLHGHIGTYETVIKTTDGGYSWSVPLVSGVYENIRSVFFSDSATGIAVGDSSIYHFGYAAGIGEVSYREAIPGTLLDVSFAADKKYGIISGSEYGFVMTSDSGNTWNPPFQPFQAETFNGVAMLDDKTAIGVCSDGTCYGTDNGGETWGKQMIDPGNSFYCVAFPDSKHGTIVGYNGAIFHTNDGGNTWARQESGTTKSLASVFFVDANNGWIVGEGGTILHTTTGGDGAVNAVKSSASTLPITPSVDFLNPASLRYDVPFDADVQISIFDATGQERIPILARHEISGQYTIPLTISLPNGFYFYRIKALSVDGNTSLQSGKIIVLH